MGHQVDHLTFSIKESRQNIMERCNDYANEDADYRNPIDNIRFVDKTFVNRDEAVAWIEQNDRCWYDQICVKYYERIPKKDTAAIAKMVARLNELADKFSKKNSEIYASTISSAFFACRTCGSKLNREYMLRKSNVCPVCYKDLRSETVLSQLKKQNAAIVELRAKIADARDKNSVQGELKYLVIIHF